jgi:hypothetical protein
MLYIYIIEAVFILNKTTFYLLQSVDGVKNLLLIDIHEAHFQDFLSYYLRNFILLLLLLLLLHFHVIPVIYSITPI